MKNKEIKLPTVFIHRSKPILVRPAGSHGVSEAQLEARRRTGMLWFMHKRDQQKDWS